ncbi:MAG: penicillin acylase family protein [Polymorphobacter sp.]|uniref:penicillin acylase family protein n=1 Tax=Polymorphobacter sp. TaxID=1909290 RepID=UPI003A842F4E
MRALVFGVMMGLAVPVAAQPMEQAMPAYGGGEILWDSYGVPHVFANREAGAFYGFGWAQAQAHGNILLKMYGESRARGAEYWGASGEALDRWLLANDVPARAQSWFAAQTPAMRENLEAFAAGINAYAAAHPDAIAPEMRQVLPISGVDIIGHAHRLMNFNYVVSEGRVMADLSPAGEGEAPSALEPEGSDGSNAWAVMPKRTAAGKTLLLANPHLPWAPSMLTYFEIHLEAPGYSIYGGTQVGLPIIRFAFNDNMGFTHTVNNMRGFTRYELKLDGEGYRFDGALRPFETAKKSYKVRQPDGTLKTVRFTQRRSLHGPVFDMPGAKGAFALKVAGLDRPGVIQQYLDMAKAQNFAQFEAALKTLQVPTFNIIYGDRDGHIMYLDNGILPKYPDNKSYDHWAGLVPGDTSATLWSEVHPYEDLPKVIDPPGGFVQNANDGPWVSTWPRVLNPADWPAYIVNQSTMSMRAQMAVRLMAGEDKISWDDFLSRKVTTTSLMAERMIPPLLEAVGETDDPDLVQAKLLLAGWDRRYEADSRAALLFESWAKRLAGPSLTGEGGFAEGWRLEDAIETPRGLKDPAAAVAMLKQAVADTRAQFGAVDRPLGEVSRFKLAGAKPGDFSIAGHGGLGNLGIFRVMTWSPMKDGERQPLHGETWVSMVEFGTPMKAVGVMSYGNSSQPGSKHRTDQLELVQKKQFRTLWRTRAEIEQNLEERVAF